MAIFTRARTNDDRGQVVDAIDENRLKREAEGRNSPRYQLALRLRRAVRGRANQITPRTLLVVVGTVTLGIFLLAVFPAQYARYIFLAVCVSGGLAATAFVRRDIAHSMAASAVAEGFCGTCAYSLHGLTPEPDGCLVCAECGSAWRASRVVITPGRPPPERYSPNILSKFMLGTPREERFLSPDDRGRFVRTLDTRLRLLAPGLRSQLGPEVNELRAALRAPGRILRAVLAAPFPLLTVFLLYLVSTTDHPSPGQRILMALFVLAVPGGVGLGIWLGDLGIPRRKVREVCLSRSLCPSCATRLDATSATDGYVVCPACAASWKAGDLPIRAAPADIQPPSA